MAPLPESSTARVFLDYTSCNIEHTFEFRLGAGATLTTAADRAELVAALLATRMTDNDSIIRARFSQQGQNFSLPLTFTPVQGVLPFDGGGPWWVEDPQSAFISLIGRGQTTARRARWFFYTPVKTITWPADNRYQTGEAAVIDTFRENWEALIEDTPGPGSQIVTIGGDIPLVYGYVNIAKNGYWQRKQR